jgi:hypothetical protein
LRISITQGSAGARWSIGTEGTGIAVSPLRAGMSVLRGACVDANGFLVMAAADRAVPDLVSRALALAGCADDGRVALTGVALLLANGQTASGEAAPAHADATFALVAREFPLARPMFTDVTPVPRSVWYPVQTRRVRYFPNPGNNVTVQVRLSGQQPQVFTLPGIGRRFVEQAYPDGGAPPEVPPGGN